jgi:hypothetical protein
MRHLLMRLLGRRIRLLMILRCLIRLLMRLLMRALMRVKRLLRSTALPRALWGSARCACCGAQQAQHAAQLIRCLPAGTEAGRRFF